MDDMSNIDGGYRPFARILPSLKSCRQNGRISKCGQGPGVGEKLKPLINEKMKDLPLYTVVKSCRLQCHRPQGNI